MPDGGYLLVKALKRHGVNYIFTLSGLQTQSIYNACIDEGIYLIDTRHEQTAVFMADAWARATGQPGVALLSAGPGMTNGITGIANAYAASSPAVVIAGKSPLAELDKGAFQELDQLPLVKTITKWAASISKTDEIPDILNTAFKYASSGRPGPTYIDIPVDVLSSQVEIDRAVFGNTSLSESTSYDDQKSVNKALELLSNAKRPMILAGSGIRWKNAGDHVKAFIETTGIPLITIDMAKGVVPDDHPLCFGPVWTSLKHADVIMICGARVDYSLSFGQSPTFNEDAKIIQIDSELSELGKNRQIDIGISGDISAILKQMYLLANQAKWPNYSNWINECHSYTQEQHKRISTKMNSNDALIHPLTLCNKIKHFLNRDATIVVDGGDTSVFGRAVLEAYYPGHWLDVGPLWCIGIGVPFGLAAKLARTDKQTLILSGDGSFGYGVFEYNTALRHNIPIVSVINNDGAWGMIKHDQEDSFGEHRVTCTELGITRYDKIVEALGGYGEYVEKPDDILPALQRAFASGLPACINVKVDPASTSKGIFAVL
ncbi:thiamine pyrophosphate-binding protein [Chloroflexota bacterium]